MSSSSFNDIEKIISEFYNYYLTGKLDNNYNSNYSIRKKLWSLLKTENVVSSESCGEKEDAGELIQYFYNKYNFNIDFDINIPRNLNNNFIITYTKFEDIKNELNETKKYIVTGLLIFINNKHFNIFLRKRNGWYFVEDLYIYRNVKINDIHNDYKNIDHIKSYIITGIVLTKPETFNTHPIFDIPPNPSFKNRLALCYLHSALQLLYNNSDYYDLQNQLPIIIL